MKECFHSTTSAWPQCKGSLRRNFNEPEVLYLFEIRFIKAFEIVSKIPCVLECYTTFSLHFSLVCALARMKFIDKELSNPQ